MTNHEAGIPVDILILLKESQKIIDSIKEHMYERNSKM